MKWWSRGVAAVRPWCSLRRQPLVVSREWWFVQYLLKTIISLVLWLSRCRLSFAPGCQLLLYADSSPLPLSCPNFMMCCEIWQSTDEVTSVNNKEENTQNTALRPHQDEFWCGAAGFIWQSHSQHYCCIIGLNAELKLMNKILAYCKCSCFPDGSDWLRKETRNQILLHVHVHLISK